MTVKVSPLAPFTALDPEQGGTGLNADTLTAGQTLIWNGDEFVGGSSPSGATQDKTANYNIQSTDQLVRCNAAGGAFVTTLPPAASVTGQTFNIKKIDATANAVTLDGNGAETIDGAANVVIINQYANVVVRSNGISWDRL